MKIAMRSGPRNLTTAMLSAFAARDDCTVTDEPFYTAWLMATGRAHPMAAEILAAPETDPARVAEALAADPHGRPPHRYARHMSHHRRPGFRLDWAQTWAHPPSAIRPACSRVTRPSAPRSPPRRSAVPSGQRSTPAFPAR